MARKLDIIFYGVWDGGRGRCDREWFQPMDPTQFVYGRTPDIMCSPVILA